MAGTGTIGEGSSIAVLGAGSDAEDVGLSMLQKHGSRTEHRTVQAAPK